ncbi:LDH2 family malate/lactate/ureidoglycolate dehydrogenase [Arthrobacter sp. CAN_A214]|uniref:Ldh family oxidoreductase n=1 Tax=Arthrobacter sp. CAN_A214 TaxID=2787720 RepID=UPI0018C9FE1C
MQFSGVGKIREQIEIILRHWGMSEENINITAIAMSDADLSGIDSRGISMLMKYDALVSGGRLDMRAQTEIVTETPAIAVLDAKAGLGHPAAMKAMDLAIDKAQTLGVGAVAVFNSHHFGAAGYYVRRAAARGLIGMITTTAASVAVIPTGGMHPALGINPLAFAAPSSGGEPFVLDMSTSTVAMNKVKMYALKKEKLPQGWVVDGAGKSITDSTLAYE